ncbi:uncharacterized protein LOC114280831 [Camellia sinensis]|uniref:uncharacterized protein LOC114280831 n=1 Tax=Camellia sinensis TaxID=4442 RepID=UPI00103664BC|nr:uncharacterized protein LOC114280831 [Camellia sinensis]
MDVPPGFSSQSTVRKVYRLKKALYGLKQSPQAWFDRFLKAMLRFGYKQNNANHTMLVKRYANKVIVLIVYVDDIVVTENDEEEVTHLKILLAKEFEIQDLGSLRMPRRGSCDFPPSAQEELRRQFVELLQELVETEELRCSEFESRLCDDIRERIAGSWHRSYSVLVRAATHVEAAVLAMGQNRGEATVLSIGQVREEATSATPVIQSVGRPFKRQKGFNPQQF